MSAQGLNLYFILGYELCLLLNSSCFSSYCVGDTAAMPVWDYGLYSLRGLAIGLIKRLGFGISI